jgi:hypothetical protein
MKIECDFFHESSEGIVHICKKEKTISTRSPPNFKSLFIFMFNYISDTIAYVNESGVRGFTIQNYIYEYYLTDDFRKNSIADMYVRERIPILLNLKREEWSMDVYTLFNKCIANGILTHNLQNVHLIDLRFIHQKDIQDLYRRVFVSKNFKADTVSIPLFLPFFNFHF